MEFVIAIAYTVLIIATLMVRRSLKMRDHRSARQLNVRSSAKARGNHL
jgi:hypothetical protein